MMRVANVLQCHCSMYDTTIIHIDLVIEVSFLQNRPSKSFNSLTCLGRGNEDDNDDDYDNFFGKDSDDDEKEDPCV